MLACSCAARAALIAAAASWATRAIATMGSTPMRCPTTTSCRASELETGAHIWIAETRRSPNVAIDQTVKNFNRMDLTKGTFEALDHGADAAVLLSTEGYVTEGAGFNIWIVRGKTLLTPTDNLLEGITRHTVFDLAREIGINANTANLEPNELIEATEAFLSTTAGGIVPVTRVNDRPLGNGAPGLMTTNIRNRYWDRRRAGWHGTSVDSLLN